MEKYKNKEVTVLTPYTFLEAVQLTEKNKDEVYNWASQHQTVYKHNWDKEPWLMVPQGSREEQCMVGNYLVKWPETSFAILKVYTKESFEKVYEKVESFDVHVAGLKLRPKDIEKGIKAFAAVREDSVSKMLSLLESLKRESMNNGASQYAISLCNSIQLENKHIENAENEINRYRGMLQNMTEAIKNG